MLAAVGAALFRPDLLVGTGPATAEDTHIAPPPQVPAPRRQQVAGGRQAHRGGPRRAHGPRGPRVACRPSSAITPTSAGSWPSRSRAGASRTTTCPTTRPALAELIRRGELVEVKPVTDDYILYGVGANADRGAARPLRPPDRARGHAVPALGRVRRRARRLPRRGGGEERGHRGAARGVPQDDHEDARRPQPPQGARHAGQAGPAEVAAIEKRIASDAAWYDDYDRRQMLVGEWELLHEIAASLGGRAYDLEQASDRRAFRARAAELPAAGGAGRHAGDRPSRYRAEFGRPLAFTSLVRSEDYQLQLGETNANATQDRRPPAHHRPRLRHLLPVHDRDRAGRDHGTDRRAWSREGRLEALRENRDHFHMFAFARGPAPAGAADRGGAGRRAAGAARLRRLGPGEEGARGSASRRSRDAQGRGLAAEGARPHAPTPAAARDARPRATSRAVAVLDQHQAGADLVAAA